MLINTPTPIDAYNKIDFISTPKHIQVSLPVNDTFAYMFIWIWHGNLNTPPINHTIAIYQERVSASDTFLEFEISDYIKPYIDPTINFGSVVEGNDEGVFYQYEIHFGNGNKILPPTRFATLGWDWDYEGERTFSYSHGAFGFESINIPKYYNTFIDYYNRQINLGAISSSAMVTSTLFVPPTELIRCTQEPYLIQYINKYGLWDTFTPTGSVVVNTTNNRVSYQRTYRNILNVNRQTDFQSTDLNISVEQTYIINTGLLLESMGELVEEILYSPKVYLIEFKGDLTPSNQYITADTTLVTADTTLYTADNSGIGNNKYKTYRQIPVTVLDSDFLRKTRLSNKAKLSYNIRFGMSASKINNLK